MGKLRLKDFCVLLREHESSVSKPSIRLSFYQLKDSDLYIIPSMFFISQSGLDVRDTRNLYYLNLCQTFFLSLRKWLFAQSGLYDSGSLFLFGKHVLSVTLLQLSSGKAYLIKWYGYWIFFKDCPCNHWTWIGGWEIHGNYKQQSRESLCGEITGMSPQVKVKVRMN